MSLVHDSPATGHPGQLKTILIAQRDFWWPGMTKDIRQFVTGCATCQATKPITTPVKIPIMPINKEEHDPWEVISEDHITDLPESHGYNCIYVVVDHGSTKTVKFIPSKKTDTAEDTAHQYFDNVYRHYGWPRKRISDRGTLFNSSWLKEMCRLTGTEQAMSTAYHPQTDGETERVNQELELFLRTFCSMHQNSWVEWLPLAEFCHNSRPHSTIKMSPFEALMGYTPKSIVLSEMESSNPSVEQRLSSIKQARTNIVLHQNQANKIMARRRGQSYVPFSVNDRVWLDGKNLKTLMPTAKFNPKRYGPFTITEKINDVAYKLQLPTSMKIWPVFHASLLHPYKETIEHGPNFPMPPPVTTDDTEEWEVEAIINDRRHYGKKQYLVKWLGYPSSDNTWEPEENIANATEALSAYLKQRGEKISHKRGGKSH